MFRLFRVLLVLLVAASWGVIAAAKDLVDDLMQMSDAELEKICAERGFALIKDEIDEESGEIIVFRHEDYVEAARQCLSVEVQMEQVMKDHPELIPELEKEAERLRKEKKELTERIMDAERAKFFADLAAQEEGGETKTTLEGSSANDNIDKGDIQALLERKRALETERDEKLAAKARLEAELETRKNGYSSSSSSTTIEEQNSQSQQFMDEKEHHAFTTSTSTTIAESSNEQLQEMGKTVGELLPAPIREVFLLTGKAVLRLSGDMARLLEFVKRHVKAIVDSSVRLVDNKRRGRIDGPQEKEEENTQTNKPYMDDDIMLE